MSAHLKKLANGHLIKNAAGHLVKECPNPCDPDREMLVTVTGGVGAINWCGEVWNLPGDSGVQKSVCPATDIKLQFYTTFFPNSANATDRWTITNLSLNRNWFQTPLYYAGINRLTVQGEKDSRYYTIDLLLPTSKTATPFSTINKVLGVAFPNYTAYALTDEFFGNHTIAGITYAWEKGGGW